MKALTVRIIKAKRPTYWYSRMVGETFEVYPDASNEGDSYILKEDKDRGDVTLHWIRREDCEEVTL
jgi:hypothetical protein